MEISHVPPPKYGWGGIGILSPSAKLSPSASASARTNLKLSGALSNTVRSYSLYYCLCSDHKDQVKICMRRFGVNENVHSLGMIFDVYCYSLQMDFVFMNMVVLDDVVATGRTGS